MTVHGEDLTAADTTVSDWTRRARRCSNGFAA
jgi:hypothetical protein